MEEPWSLSFEAGQENGKHGWEPDEMESLIQQLLQTEDIEDLLNSPKTLQSHQAATSPTLQMHMSGPAQPERNLELASRTSEWARTPLMQHIVKAVRECKQEGLEIDQAGRAKRICRQALRDSGCEATEDQAMTYLHGFVACVNRRKDL